jgi:hypothetical protein
MNEVEFLSTTICPNKEYMTLFKQHLLDFDVRKEVNLNEDLFDKKERSISIQIRLLNLYRFSL